MSGWLLPHDVKVTGYHRWFFCMDLHDLLLCVVGFLTAFTFILQWTNMQTGDEV